MGLRIYELLGLLGLFGILGDLLALGQKIAIVMW